MNDDSHRTCAVSSGFQRLFLGSVTEKVIRKATCPTLVVPPRAPGVSATTPIQFRRILCPVDFSESSLDALAYAINMAEQADAWLTLLHVVEIPVVLSQQPTVLDLDLSRIREAAVGDARGKLHELIPEHARTYCTVETAVVEGRAYREVTRQYKGQNPLVLGAVPMARIIADALQGELDVVLVRKLRAPGQPELAIGAVDEAGSVLKGRYFDVAEVVCLYAPINFYAVGQFFDDFSEVTDEMVVTALSHAGAGTSPAPKPAH